MCPELPPITLLSICLRHIDLSDSDNTDLSDTDVETLPDVVNTTIKREEQQSYDQYTPTLNDPYTEPELRLIQTAINSQIFVLISIVQLPRE